MRKLPIIILVLVVVTAAFLTLTKKTSTEQPTPSISSGPDVSNLIKVEQPKSGQLIKSPVYIKGEARGNWYFEASFPIKMLDANGNEIGVSFIMSSSDWMTTEFVPFESYFEFKKPSTETGTLVLQKDNPSGLPEHDAELRIPVAFDLENWVEKPVSSGECRVTGCSGQICSDEDVITTCEFKEEFTCYKDAKCERQDDGKCGWTPNEELVACLYQAWGTPPEEQ